MTSTTSGPVADAQPAVYTVAEAAKIARIGRNAMYDLISTGEVPHRRIGRLIRIPAEAFHRWLSGS